jgi:hypothetical protein
VRAQYTQLIYAAPYTEENLEGLAYILDKIVTTTTKQHGK